MLLHQHRMILLLTSMAVLAGARLGLAWGPAEIHRSRPPLVVIPQPRQVNYQGSALKLHAVRQIRVTDSQADRFAAGLLQKALHEVLGTSVTVTSLRVGATDRHDLVLCDDASSPLPPAPPDVAKDKRNEGYGLRVTDRGAHVTARNEAGLFYGVQTLIQLTEQAGREKKPIPGLIISDWPEFDWRSAAYIEGSQSKNSVIVCRANIEQTIQRLARYKMNCLTIEIYNLAPFASFPYCADTNTLSRADWEALVELGRRYHVSLMPSLQSFGQISEVIWNCDQGKPYRETTAPGLLCPSQPGSVKFLQGLYKDLMSIFKTSPYLGIGCSEVWIQWNKKYCPLCQKRVDSGETEWDIYCKHVVNCTDAVTSAAKELNRDVRPLMWADEFYMYNSRPRYAGLDKMPKRMVMGHWQYFDKYWVLNNYHYDGIEGLIERGFDVLFVSACWPVNNYLVDLSPADPSVAEGKFTLIKDAGLLNIIDEARWAQAYRAKGHPGKVLGGLCATFSQHDIRCWDTTWLGYALHGDYTWGDPSRPWAEYQMDFIHDFAATFYGARNVRSAATIATAYRELDAAKSDLERNHYLIRDAVGEYDMADPAYQNTSLEQSCKLIRELMTKPQGPDKTVADVRKRAEKARAVARKWRQALPALGGQVTNTQSLDYLVLAAHKMQNHVERTLFLLDQEAALAGLDKEAPNQKTRLALRKKIHALQSQLAGLTEDTRGLLAEMRKLTWFTDDFATGYYGVMSGLEGCHKRLNDADNNITRTMVPRVESGKVRLWR